MREMSIRTRPAIMQKPANASGALFRASNGVAEACMQLPVTTENLQPRQISRARTTRADLAGFRMTTVGYGPNIRELTQLLLQRLTYIAEPPGGPN